MEKREILYNSFPRSFKELIEEEAKYAGIDDFSPKNVINIYIVFYIFSMILLIYMTWTKPFSNIIMWGIITVVMCVGILIPYTRYSLMAEKRGKAIEKMLPDILFLTSSNIKSGLTIDRAMLFSARPEFGAIGVEFKKVALDIYGGIPVEKAFTKLSKKIKSKLLANTVKLLAEGLRSGGAVAKLLEETATDIQNTEILQKEIQASVMMYTIFIFMAAVLGAPFLFAVSNFLTHSLTSMWSASASGPSDTTQDDIQGSLSSSISVSSPDVDLEALHNFSIYAILLTTICGGILISYIQKGNISAALKYSPAFAISAIIIFFLARGFLFKVFGGMLGL
ncbi:MAG: type II secretion system F family protein [Candidatus Aenigmarchaeota archaeon]|nr:type II secretion system F family protein [Candidatus Aenigmarchaeota archaeon]